MVVMVGQVVAAHTRAEQVVAEPKQILEVVQDTERTVVTVVLPQQAVVVAQPPRELTPLAQQVEPVEQENYSLTSRPTEHLVILPEAEAEADHLEVQPVQAGVVQVDTMEQVLPEQQILVEAVEVVKKAAVVQVVQV